MSLSPHKVLFSFSICTFLPSLPSLGSLYHGKDFQIIILKSNLLYLDDESDFCVTPHLKPNVVRGLEMLVVVVVGVGSWVGLWRVLVASGGSWVGGSNVVRWGRDVPVALNYGKRGKLCL